ncbi:hypothetical protein [Mucilaginibacter antarcticus]|uniref:Carboxypeptidase-like protein n=1 Tax=Mucilaginibacter antarcticus TaxID=1855725 RepID=A0ABW5XKF8_9SPHI
MKPIFVIFLCLFCIRSFAQETSVAGIIFDAESKDRLSRVNILNTRTGYNTYNNINGVFNIDAQPGDKLIFSQAEHFPDTVLIKNFVPIAVYLKRIAIQLKQVTIYDTVSDPLSRLANKRRDYSKIYGSIAYNDLLSVNPSTAGIGVGLSIDALYNAWSKAGRNAAHLRETIDNDYKQDVIDYRFNRALVGRITALKGSQLADFMRKYRPGYYFLTNASEYEFITSIKANLKRFLRNPGAHAIAPLNTPQKQ